MNAAERAMLARDYPNHYFTRVTGHGYSVLLAIPKNPLKQNLPIRLMPGIGVEMLHGATLRIGR